MNLLPVPPDRLYDLGRPNELTTAVTAARKPREPASEREQAARDRPTEVMDAIQREVLVSEYVGLSAKPRVGEHANDQHAQRAVSAYETVAHQDKRDILADMLGVSEYA